MKRGDDHRDSQIDRMTSGGALRRAGRGSIVDL